ncbi:MAG TPA: ABC transporter permease [Anaerolineales bacterium]|nr:ABC transporter permease [Anaerolineales bacterium]
MTRITEAADVGPRPVSPVPKIAKDAEIRYYTASQFQLMWWKFKKHRLAIIGTVILAVFVFIALFAEFLSPYTPGSRTPNYLFGGPQAIHFVDADGNFHPRPFTYALTAAMDPETFLLEVKEDTSEPWPVYFFVRGDPYKMWGLIESDIHLFGVQEGHLHLLGTDQLGRDILSRLFHATRTSLTIGVVGLFISFFLGLIIGGISGFFGGSIDEVIQRFIEFIRSIPTLPLWMALAAALPREWSPQRVYFTITILLGLLGWTHLARRVRGKLLSLREEDFVVAARIAGSSDTRIIARHLLPSFLSYIIVDLSISFPYMILAETSLSFIGLGLRAPVISWGVLLQDAQNIQAIALYPWLFTPVAFVIISVMAFSFVGDGMRDAADPYSR